MHAERLKLWLPIRSLGYVNVYAFTSGGRVTLIDAGMLSGRTILDLVWGLKELGYTLCDVERVILTHFHVDHSSIAAILTPCGAEIVMSGNDARVVKGDVRGFIEAAANLFRLHGAPVEEVNAMIEHHPALRLEYAFSKLKESDIKIVDDGDYVQAGDVQLKVISTPGHTPGSIVLLDMEENSIYSGDTLLPGITPHITLHDPSTDPLGDYMNSLRRLAALSPTIAYPGHREPIKAPAQRAMEILEHHRERLDEIEAIIRQLGRATAYDIAKRVRWRTRYNSWSEYPPPEKFFALGETLAHLRRLEVEGRAEPVGDGGVVYWTSAE